MALRSPARRNPTRNQWSHAVPARRTKRHFRVLRRLLALFFVLVLGSVLVGAYLMQVYAPGLRAEARTIPARVNAQMAQQGASYTPLSSMAFDLQHAIVAIEDHRFYEHHGIDPLGILRALYLNTKNQHIDQGGSTLEEQLAKRAIVGNDRSIHQKLRTIGLAWAIDGEFTKGKILELYLNAAYFGRGAYGAGAAARIYFGTDVGHLTLSQAAFLAAMPQAPSIYGSNPTAPIIRHRWKQVLYDMFKDGFITSDQWTAAVHSPPSFIFATS